MTSKTARTETPLRHAAWCSKARDLDVTEHPDAGITTTHCVECGAHQAHASATGEVLPAPINPGPFHNARRPFDDGITMTTAGEQA